MNWLFKLYFRDIQRAEETIEACKKLIEETKKEIKSLPRSETATIPQPWASMSAQEIKESMGVYK